LHFQAYGPWFVAPLYFMLACCFPLLWVLLIFPLLEVLDARLQSLFWRLDTVFQVVGGEHPRLCLCSLLLLLLCLRVFESHLWNSHLKARLSPSL